ATRRRRSSTMTAASDSRAATLARSTCATCGRDRPSGSPASGAAWRSSPGERDQACEREAMTWPTAMPDAEQFMAAMDAVSDARLEDLVRFVGRQLREDASLASHDFKTGWLIVLGGYLELALRP